MIELSPSAVIGQYKLIRPLREPLHCHSWLAEAADGQRVVLKLFAHGTSVPPSGQFNQLLKLNHPALETSWIRFEDDNWSGFARPYYQDLSHPGESGFALDHMLALGMRLAEALLVCHDNGLTHGRLQGSNLFTRDNTQLIVTDFDAVTGNAPIVDEATDGLLADLRACGDILSTWTEGLEDSHPRSGGENTSPLLPPRLAWLIETLKEPGEMLSAEGFARIRDELDDIRLQWQRALREGIPANWSEGRADYRPETRTATKPESATLRQYQWQPVAAVLVLALLLIGAIWILPAYFSVDNAGRGTQIPAATETTIADAATEEPEPPTEEEIAALLELRERAQATLDEVINLRLQLESQEVTRWAEKEFADAIVIRDAGDIPYRKQEFTAAMELYSQARAALQLIDEQSRQVADQNIARGHEALDRGDSSSAADAFGLALNIDPENAQASTGLQRAGSLDEVLALMEEANDLEETGSWEQARERFKQIQKLDPHTPGIDTEIIRIDAAIAQRNFRSAMSAGLAALDAGDLLRARIAFNSARGMRPSAIGPREGLQEVNRQERDLTVLHQREQALAQEQSENWQEAVSLYLALLEQDPNLRFAQDSVIRARDRANLDSELSRYLSNPSNWWSENGRKQAESLLVEARSASNPGPRLQQQIRQLGTEIERAGRQVPVRLQSDNLCNVVVYKVGHLGQFQTTELTLYPGYYTVVGVRDGYRDARREFLVRPDQQQAVTITCDEAI